MSVPIDATMCENDLSAVVREPHHERTAAPLALRLSKGERHFHTRDWAGIAAYAGLLKSKVVALLLVVALVTAVVASDGQIEASRLLLLALSGALAASGAAALNHYADRDIDAVMSRTKGRPLPAGALRPSTALRLGLALVGLGILLSLPLGLWTTFFLTLGAVIYLPVYTLWLKRRSALNIVIGGGAGSCAALAGWAAAGSGHLLETSLLAGLVFLWTPSHFWSYAVVHREDYRQACLPMLPMKVSPTTATTFIVAHSALVVGLALALAYPLRAFGGLYAVGAAASSVLPVWAGWRLLRHPGRDSAYFNFKASGAYLGLLFLFILVDVLM